MRMKGRTKDARVLCRKNDTERGDVPSVDCGSCLQGTVHRFGAGRSTLEYGKREEFKDGAETPRRRVIKTVDDMVVRLPIAPQAPKGDLLIESQTP
jgi:hypothetical protein